MRGRPDSSRRSCGFTAAVTCTSSRAGKMGKNVAQIGQSAASAGRQAVQEQMHHRSGATALASRRQGPEAEISDRAIDSRRRGRRQNVHETQTPAPRRIRRGSNPPRKASLQSRHGPVRRPAPWRPGPRDDGHLPVRRSHANTRSDLQCQHETRAKKGRTPSSPTPSKAAR